MQKCVIVYTLGWEAEAAAAAEEEDATRHA